MLEKELVERSKKGDEEAFAELMHTYEGKIYQQCLGIIKDEELAKDVTQETFVHAYQHLSTFRMESQFYTWIYRIAKNLSLNLLRKRKHREQELKEELFVIPVSPEAEPIKEEIKVRMFKALKELPEKQRIVIELFDIQNLSIKEIATQLKIPSGTVRSRLFYARKKMREIIDS